MESTTAEATKKSLPPTVITVDTGNPANTAKESGRDDSEEHRQPPEHHSDEDTPPPSVEAEGRTPKHANKASLSDGGGDSKQPKVAAPSQSSSYEQSQPTHQGTFLPPRPFDGRMGGPTGAFQPHDRIAQQQQQNRLLSLQVSPGTGRYYASFSSAVPSGRYGPGYDQHHGAPRSMHDYPHGMQYGQHAAMYPPQQQYPQQGYGQRQPPPGWAPNTQPPPPPSYHGRPPPYPSQSVIMASSTATSSYAPNSGSGPVVTGGNTFSRAVSSSFDRSIKSRNSDDKMTTHQPQMETSPQLGPASHHAHHPHHQHHQSSQGQHNDGSVSEDASWRQLNQIQSVDEEEIRKRLAKRSTPTDGKEVDVKQPASNSSSLTNSPTEGVEHHQQKKAALPEPPKMTSSLDSLSSVASAQEPLDTSKAPASGAERKTHHHSPSGSAAESLDLMKCSSGSSALLLPADQRNLSQIPEEAVAGAGSKRNRGESRGDAETSSGAKETRKGPNDDARRSKKGRVEGADGKKASPLSIACSPPSDGDKDRKAHAASAYYTQNSKDSFYDKPPNYTYSIDSAPPLPRDQSSRDAYPSLPPRPQSSASSTVTPMQMATTHERTAQPLGVSQLPSWEIQGQDSFGGGSTGNPLMSSFSFSHDYPMLSSSNSGGNEPGGSHHHHPPGAPPHARAQPDQRKAAMESRNQSFEGGHYHGSFSRAESMSFDSRGQGVPEHRQGYQGPFPPHAPSWGSAGSYPQPSTASAFPQYRMTVHPIMMRTFSQDSDPRGLPPGFQPPSEFQAPPSNLKSRQRKETHIMTTPYVPSKSGVFGWTKEEDMRLTEIMKKYKNPRDWEPIAKELDRNRTAKECHERWIRYLKPGVRKGQWTDQEDAIVMEAVTSSKEQPFTRWSDLAQRLPGRVGKQIRDRWVNHLNPNINHLPFSREDDLLLWEGHQKVGKRWVEIATKFFKSSRSENHIKNRWYSASFKKFIANEFGPQAYAGSKGSRSPKKEGSGKKNKGKQQHDSQSRGPVDDSTFHVSV